MAEWKRPAIVARLSFPDPRLSCYSFGYASQAAATADCEEERMLKLHGTSMSSAGRCLWALEELGRAYHWSFGAVAEIEPHLIVMIRQEMFTPPEECDLRAIEGASEAIKAPLKVLDDHLKGRDYILSNKFTIADLNVAGVLLSALLVGYDTSLFPALTKWFEKCVSRDAHQRNRSRN